jgi:hypothetical protein
MLGKVPEGRQNVAKLISELPTGTVHEYTGRVKIRRTDQKLVGGFQLAVAINRPFCRWSHRLI